MALETLVGVEEIGGFKVVREELGYHLNMNYFDLDDKDHVIIDDDYNAILFKIQNGPIKENGVNGCQVDTLIHAAKIILTNLLKENGSCEFTERAVQHCRQAVSELKDREKRGVEGTSKV